MAQLSETGNTGGSRKGFEMDRVANGGGVLWALMTGSFACPPPLPHVLETPQSCWVRFLHQEGAPDGLAHRESVTPITVGGCPPPLPFCICHLWASQILFQG